MSLDQNLFTLHVTPSKDDPNIVDLVDPSGTVHYRKRRISGVEYKVEVIDPLSESILITASAPSPTSKAKVLELCNPTSVVELKYTGTISFRWGFKWEEHDFEWKREECYMIRKPDPPVLVAVTKEPTGRLRTTSVQILDYNLNRFDIDDRKGLEIVILTALLTFHDSNDSYHTKERGSSTAPAAPTVLSYNRSATLPGSSDDDGRPTPPPRPAPKTGIDRIAEMQAQRGEYNEVVVEAEGSIEDYAQYCSNLLQDGAMLFITVKSSESNDVPKVLQVVEETKRIRYKAGLDDSEELHQYVLYDTEPKKGPKRINLNDDADKKSKYKPPQSLSVHLSKISMPELQPKRNANDKVPSKDSRKEEKKVTTQHATPSTERPSIKLKHPGVSPFNKSSSTPTPSQLSNGPALFPPPRKSSNNNHTSHSGHPPSPPFPTHSITPPSSHWSPSPSFPTPSVSTPSSQRPPLHSQPNFQWSPASPPVPPPLILANPQAQSIVSSGNRLSMVSGIFDKFHQRR